MVSEWQPIETAPKDGRDILGCAGGSMTVVRWMTLSSYWTLAETGAYAEDGEWWPEYWQPLPMTPQAGA